MWGKARSPPSSKPASCGAEGQGGLILPLTIILRDLMPLIGYLSNTFLNIE
jgi:hypothetical protein